MKRIFPCLFLVLYFVFVNGMMPAAAHTNGNIDVKHGTAHPIGSYYYDSSRPHAVIDIENPLGAVDLPSDYVSVSYNELGKAATVTDDGNPYITYHYGPDHGRWRGVQHVGSSTWSNLYFGDYEERYVNSNSRRSFVYLDGGVLAVSNNGGSYQFYYIHTDHQGSILAITDAQGSYVFKATYDAWGRQTVTVNALAFQRGYTGHEMMREGGLINMNGRIYDSAIGLFLSPDNYVQEPLNSQNFNRYSYCLNNPLKYVDPDGEWLHILFGAVVGGIVNLATNWDNVDGFWQGFTTFLTGAGTGAAVAATGGSVSAGGWAVAGVSAAGGAVTSVNNSIVAQTGKNFSGIENIKWSDIGKAALVGAFSGAASGAAGYYASSASFTVNHINSPLLRSAVVSPLAAATGHVVSGTSWGLLEGRSFTHSFCHSFKGILGSMALGEAIGVASTLGDCYIRKVNPWTGNSLRTDIAPYYPPNDGALDDWTNITLEERTIIDRYGSERGMYASPVGVPYEQRSLPPNNSGEYHQYRVLTPFMVQKSAVMPWFNQIGLASSTDFR